MDALLLRTFQAQIAGQCRIALIMAGTVQKVINTSDTPDIDLLWAGVQSFLTAVANISKACWGQGGKLAVEREQLRHSLQITDESPIKPTSMRNNFDHFDERLDRWWSTSESQLHVDELYGPDYLIGGVAPTDIFRWFNPETGEVIFWGDRYPLKPICDEVIRIGQVAEEEMKGHWAE